MKNLVALNQIEPVGGGRSKVGTVFHYQPRFSRGNFFLSCSRFLGFLIAAVHLFGFGNAPMLTRAEAQEHGSFVGHLLIATPRMTSPIFSKTVIVILRHERKGAMGIIINRPIGDRSMASLLGAFGEKTITATGSVRIHGGGPIEPGIGFVIHTRDYQSPPTIGIDERIAVTSSLEIFRDIGRNRGPQKSLIAFGYAGWGPGSLKLNLEKVSGSPRRKIQASFSLRTQTQSGNRPYNDEHRSSDRVGPRGCPLSAYPSTLGDRRFISPPTPSPGISCKA